MAQTKPTPAATTESKDSSGESKPKMAEVRTFGLVDVFEDGDIRVDRESGQIPVEEVDAFIRKAGMHGVHVMELKKEE